ncbi:MAG: aminoacetone oxidase family FAD-binding enzyme [Clostridiales bacterium]|nr:aminoacetone oxidase family FAD-binding enzyme [Clostridiales bacterium]
MTEQAPIWDLIIIGGGASGMSAAVSYQKMHMDRMNSYGQVLVLEKNDRVGKKVLATGNGRCNLSNKDMALTHFHSHETAWAESVLRLVDSESVLTFLGEIGIPVASEGNKIFPMSKSASSVVDAFRFAMKECNVSLETDAEVESIEKTEDIFSVYTKNGNAFFSNHIIVACGGACAPSLGTTGDGYKWLNKFGHKVFAPKPSIVQVVTDNSVTKTLSGLKLDCDLSLNSKDMLLAHQYGEVLFTDYGLSGPAVFQVSGVVSRYNRKNGLSIPMTISLKLFNDEELRLIRVEIGRRISAWGERTLDQLLIGILPGKIASMLLKSALARPLSILIATLSNEDIEKIVKTLKAWKFEVIGTKSLEFAQTTIGGADVSEFSYETMESNLVPGLFACGEVLDVDGDCGGYNLTWAFASGILAGRSVALHAEDEHAE